MRKVNSLTFSRGIGESKLRPSPYWSTRAQRYSSPLSMQEPSARYGLIFLQSKMVDHPHGLHHIGSVTIDTHLGDADHQV